MIQDATNTNSLHNTHYQSYHYTIILLQVAGMIKEPSRKKLGGGLGRGVDDVYI